MKTEFILCIHASVINSSEDIGDRIILSKVENHFEPLPNALMMIGQRETLEQSPAFRQVIPYTVFMKGGEVLCMQRTEKGGEKRLTGKKTIGLGGHIDSPDIVYDYNGGLAQADTLQRSIARELAEELTYDGQPVSLGLNRPQFSHVIFGNEGVNAVHLGLLNVVQLGDQIDASKFSTTDPHLKCLGMVSPADLVNDELVEPWSAEVLRYLVAQSLEAIEAIKASAEQEIEQFEREAAVEGEVVA